jgi:recombination protein RecT
MIAGIRQKVRNSGDVITWEVHLVHEKDLFDFQLGDTPLISHRPVRGDRGKIIACYSIAVMKTGDRSREVMWIDEIEEIRKASRAGNSGPWVTHYGEMVKKTVAKRHAKILPMSSDLDDLLRRDDEDDLPTASERRERAPPRTLTDALNMVASLPADDQGPPLGDQQHDLLTGEQIDAARDQGEAA